MNQGVIIDLARSSLWLIVKVAAPPLLFGLFTGLIVSIFQTITSIQEQTLAFVPKILAIFIALIIFGPWMLSTMIDFVVNLYTNFNTYLY